MALTGNITTDTTELVNTYYDKVALKAGKPFLILEQFATKSKDIPKYSGDTVQFWKRIPMDVSLTPLTEGVSPSAEDLQFQNVKATVQIHGKVVAISELLGFTSIDPEVKSKAESLGENRARTINKLYWQAIAQNLYPMRIDADSTYEGLYTCDSAGTTTTLIDDALTQADDFWNGGVVAITSGNNKGMGGYVEDFVASTDTLTISTTAPSYALNEATESESFKLATSTGITSSDPLTCAGVAKSIVILQNNWAIPFDDGYYVGVLSPFTAYDIMNDSAWINADHYAGSKKLYNGELGTWHKVRFVMDSEPWRSNAGTMGTYAENGAVFHTPIFGKECYAGVRIEGVQDQLIFHTKKQTGDNLEMYSTAGWKAYFVAKVLNSTWGVQILSGATEVS